MFWGEDLHADLLWALGLGSSFRLTAMARRFLSANVVKKVKADRRSRPRYHLRVGYRYGTLAQSA